MIPMSSNRLSNPIAGTVAENSALSTFTGHVYRRTSIDMRAAAAAPTRFIVSLIDTQASRRRVSSLLTA